VTKKIRSAGGVSVFSLPWVVAQDEGLFAAEGIEIEFVANDERKAPPAPVLDHTLVPSFGVSADKHAFENGQSDVYRACEWGQVRRATDTTRGGRIVSKRAAVASQAIFVREDSDATHPQDLRNKTIGVNFHHGSHYLAIQTLEGFLNPDEIKTVHVGGPEARFKALQDGTTDAAALMEPWIALAEKQGYRLIAEAFYVGSEIAGDNLDPETYEAINRAVKKAVARINADKKKYVHYLIESLPEQYRGELKVEDFHLPRLRYVNPSPYPEGEFEKTYDWMVRWGLIAPDATFEQIVDNRIAVAS
jgi:NitT/TauT family transport system substrate-binding protein